MQKSRKPRKKSIDNAHDADSPLPSGMGVSPVKKFGTTTEENVPKPGPAPAPSVGELPTSLTFFLSTDERRLVLKKLNRLNRDRRAALLRALRIDNAKAAINREARRG